MENDEEVTSQVVGRNGRSLVGMAAKRSQEPIAKLNLTQYSERHKSHLIIFQLSG